MENRKKEHNRLRLDSGQHRRILVAAVILGLTVFVPVLLRLYGLMVVQYEKYAALALNNQTRATSVSARRGNIYDRNMEMLAGSRTVETVYLDPHELKQSGADIPAIAQYLGQLLDLEPAWIEKQAADLSMRYKQIASRVDAQTAAELRGYINDNEISGIHLEPGTMRIYPFGTLASQVIGFTNSSNTGCEGIEAAYNSYLEGTVGKVVTTKGNNEMDMPFSYEKYIASQDGAHVVLTLDATVQACLEKQMQAAIDRYDVQNGAFGMVMDVNTGQILAMATLGGYNPNQYLQIWDTDTALALERQRLDYLTNPQDSEAYLTGKKSYSEALAAARLKQWRNRCISDGYEPGSTFKVLTLAAALDCGAVSLDTGFCCGGAEYIPGRAQLLHCWRSAGHGSQQTPQALQNSCNIAFAHIALKLGGERFYEYIQKFGILEKTGIDLSGESKGVFFDKSLVTNTEKWGTASLTSGSFGQTFKITPLQLVRAIASVVNGGKLLEPYLVSDVLDDQGNVLLHQEPTVTRQTIREDTSRIMCELIRSVVTEGTAKNASVAGFSIGGKTGTSEKIDVFDENGQRVQDKIVSFVGIAPMEDPRYIVLVALDTPSRSTGIYISGGVMAAPTVGAVMADILPYLGVEQTFSEEEAAGRRIVLEDLTGMTVAQAKKYLQSVGLEGILQGDGETVTNQLPAAGQSISGDSQVLLYLGEEAPHRQVQIPDFLGMDRRQASETAGALGLSVLVAGNTDVSPMVKVISQDIPAGEMVTVGTTIQLTFADIAAAD